MEKYNLKIKVIVKKVFGRFLDHIALKFGYRKVFHNNVNGATSIQYDKNTLLNIFYNNLRFSSFSPKHIVDVGANHGTWTREALTHFPNSKYTLIEPQFWLQDSIQDLLDSNPNISFNAVGAGEESGTFKFTLLDRDDSCSFIYSERDAASMGLRQIEVPVITLNELIKEKGLPIPDIIKIDAEGLDIQVLKGADNFFGKTEIFMVEASIGNNTYSNSLITVINFMDKNEYKLFEITDLNRPYNPQILWLVELVFIKKNGILDSFNWAQK